MSWSVEPRSLDHLLAQVCKLHHVRARALLESIGIYRGQPPVLGMLWEKEGRTHTELAELMHVTPATISKMIQRMEKAGFVIRRADAEDQRVSRVYLTDAGRAVWSDVKQAMDALEVETFDGFTEEERAALRQFLLRTRENLVRAMDHEPVP
jgi:DNA-binding MarR family transcriptional regulator